MTSDEMRGAPVQELTRRITVAEQILGRLDSKLEGHSKKINELNIFQRHDREMLQEIKTTQAQIAVSLNEHILADARDRVKVFVGIVAAVFTGLSTLGVLLWAILEMTHGAIP